MATRTTAAHAAIEGYMGTLDEAGVDLVAIPPHGSSCDKCEVWERKVLSRSGQTGTITVPSALDNSPVTINLAGTLNEAIAAGLFHPNCGHSAQGFIPGFNTADGVTTGSAGSGSRGDEQPTVAGNESGDEDPEIAALDRLEKPETWKETLAVVNKDRYSLPGFNNNCQRVVQAFELRRRGFDVIARPSETGEYEYAMDNDIANLWRSPDGNTPKWKRFYQVNGIGKRYTRPKTALLNEIKTWPPGGRGFIAFGRRGEAGHVFNVEVLEDGTVAMLDAQSGRLGNIFQLGRWPGAQRWQLLRVDDAEINPDRYVKLHKVVSNRGSKKS